MEVFKTFTLILCSKQIQTHKYKYTNTNTQTQAQSQQSIPNELGAEIKMCLEVDDLDIGFSWRHKSFSQTPRKMHKIQKLGSASTER